MCQMIRPSRGGGGWAPPGVWTCWGRRDVSRHVTSRGVTWRHVASRGVTSRRVTSRHVAGGVDSVRDGTHSDVQDVEVVLR